MIPTRLQEIQTLHAYIDAIKNVFYSVYYDIELQKPWHKDTCNVRGCGEDGLACECGFAMLEDVINNKYK